MARKKATGKRLKIDRKGKSRKNQRRAFAGDDAPLAKTTGTVKW